KPHKHNFYLCVMFTKGSGTHEIDFNSYIIEPGKVFFLRPGQTHYWKFDSEPEGFILFHSQEFYEFIFLNHKISSFPFYSSFSNPPMMALADRKSSMFADKFKEIYREYTQDSILRELKIITLLSTVYIDFLREYTSLVKGKSIKSRYLTIFQFLEKLLDKHFYQYKLPKFYASELGVTTKHLNRVVKEIINKTTTELISDRVILEAKRQIVHSDDNLTNVAANLGFSDYSYFSKQFKIKTNLTPIDFKKKYAKS
ncbi:MAG: AraC family transcriptional regulator, partial [Bacteroidota bacterium]